MVVGEGDGGGRRWWNAKLWCLEKVFSIARKNKAAEVHVVPDRYLEGSIKNPERARRTKSVQETVKAITVYSWS